ncbi:MAG: helix-turn-helix domain-containing protein [Thiotrichales bacterium]|nr:helix-turn-helix domain-containing protein [Thiotrichales bacterium]
MQIRTPLDLGLVIRHCRRKRDLSQSELARRAGVGRQWVVAIEQGKPRAELSLVLRTLSALGLSLSIDSASRASPSTDGIARVDIDAVVEAARGDGK